VAVIEVICPIVQQPYQGGITDTQRSTLRASAPPYKWYLEPLQHLLTLNKTLKDESNKATLSKNLVQIHLLHLLEVLQQNRQMLQLLLPQPNV